MLVYQLCCFQDWAGILGSVGPRGLRRQRGGLRDGQGQQQSHDPRHQRLGRVAKPRLTHTLRITLGHLSHTHKDRGHGVKYSEVKRSGTHGYSREN